MDELETRKFPMGYDVTVVRKADVLACIDDNIIDKDVALELITELEVEANQFISEGKWTGIPYIGTFRRNEASLNIRANKELLEEAANNLDKERYILFRKQIAVDGHIRFKKSRYFNYMLSCSVNKNKRVYEKIAKEKGTNYAAIRFFSITNLTIMNGDSVIHDYYGQR